MEALRNRGRNRHACLRFDCGDDCLPGAARRTAGVGRGALRRGDHRGAGRQPAVRLARAAAGGDGEARIPVSVLHGAFPGPLLALIAGTHGYEYPPITALQRLRRTLSPAALHGTLILVHVANPPSFLGRTIYYSPVDGKNLNRVYPGRADGSLSQRNYVVATPPVGKGEPVAMISRLAEGPQTAGSQAAASLSRRGISANMAAAAISE